MITDHCKQRLLTRSMIKPTSKPHLFPLCRQCMHKLPQMMMVWFTTFRQCNKEGNEKDKQQFRIQCVSSSAVPYESGPTELEIRLKNTEKPREWHKLEQDRS